MTRHDPRAGGNPRIGTPREFALDHSAIRDDIEAAIKEQLCEALRVAEARVDYWRAAAAAHAADACRMFGGTGAQMRAAREACEAALVALDAAADALAELGAEP